MSRKQFPYLNKRIIRALQLHSVTDSNESGFTLIESLLAIIVVAILLTAVTPMIVLSVGTRLQARRVELATQAARAYVDGIRTGATTPPEHVVVLAEVNTTTQVFTSQRNTLAAVPAPGSASGLTCPSTTVGYPYCTNTTTASLYCIDGDGDSQCTATNAKDFVVQAFRSVSRATATPAEKEAELNKGYILSLRVYRADAFRDTNPIAKSAGCVGNTSSTCTSNQKQSTFTGGLGQRKAPLVELTTEVVTDATKFRDFCSRFGGCQ